METFMSKAGNYRIRVEQDIDSPCPRDDWDMMTGFVKVPRAGDSRLMDVPAVHAPGIPVMDAHERFGGPSDEYVRSRRDAEALVARWARIFHGMVVEYDSEHGGYWFVSPEHEDFPSREDRPDDWQAAQQRIIDGEREVYRQWAEGEVYGVILERAVVWETGTPGTGEHRTMATWEAVDSIWGNYLDDDYTVRSVVDDYFPVEVEEFDFA